MEWRKQQRDNKSSWEYRWVKSRCKTTTKYTFLNWRKSNREIIAKKQCDPRSTVPFRRENTIISICVPKNLQRKFWSRAFIPHGAESTSFSAWPNFGGKNWNAGNAHWPPTLGFGAQALVAPGGLGGSLNWPLVTPFRNWPEACRSPHGVIVMHF